MVRFGPSSRRLFRVAAGVLLVGIAVAAAAYPLWWNHRSSTAGRTLLQHAALHTAAVLPGHSDRGAACRNKPGGQARRATPQQPGVLTIPAIGLTAPVLEGMSNAVLDVAVGHDPVTVWPGRRGESILLAHDVSYFSGLDRVRPGDLVIWTLGCRRTVFRVLGTIVTRPGVTLPVPSSGSGLALITCWPTNALFWTPNRYVVETERIAQQALAHPTTNRPPSLVALGVPAPAALAAEGLSLGQSGIPVGHLAIGGSPSLSFREGPEPLAVTNAALRDYAAAAKTAAAGNQSWWSALAVKGVPLPPPWPLAYDTNVTLVVRANTVERVVLSSPVETVTLTVRDGVLFVASVSAKH